MNCLVTEIPVRDPFVLVVNGNYYLYGTRVETCWGYADGFDVYISSDLCNWSNPIPVFHNDGSFWANQNYWAPEVHYFNTAYYMFASFKKEGKSRGTQILRAMEPTGPFIPISEGIITPDGWECLDGTICAMKLSQDLTCAVGEPWVLFDAKSVGWTKSVDEFENYVTDGPFLQRMSDGSLVML